MLKNKIIEISERDVKRKDINAKRDLDIIYDYYGLGDKTIFSYDDIGKKHGVNTRERVRQIIQRKFLNKITIVDFEDISKIIDTYNTKIAWCSNDFLEMVEGYLGKGEVSNIKSFIRLLNLCNEKFNGNKPLIKMYNHKMMEVSEKEFLTSKDTFIISDSNNAMNIKTEIINISSGLANSGSSGLFHLNDALSKIKDFKTRQFILYFMKNSDTFVVIDDAWFILEGKENIICNTLKKIANVTDTISPEILNEVVFKNVHKRTTEAKLPPIEIIDKYLKISSYVILKDGFYHIQVEPDNLSDLEKMVINLFHNKDKKVEFLTFPEIKKILKNKMSISTLHKIYTSPFVFLERSESEKTGKFYSIAKYSANPSGKNAEFPITSEIEVIPQEKIKNKFVEISNKTYKQKDKNDIHKTALYSRNPNVLSNALARAEHKCENKDCSCKLFIKNNTNYHYTEGHHLIPLCFSHLFHCSLDVEENVISLCSNCHRMLHFGADYAILLEKLYLMRKDALSKVGIVISFEELLKLYDDEKLIKA